MSSFCLKLIATFAMTLDHIAMCIGQAGLLEIFPLLSLRESSLLIKSMWTLSRIAFPVFAFLLAEGATHTRNMPKYIKRISLTAIISEPIYYFAFTPLDRTFEGFFSSILRLNFKNVFFTLAIGAFLIYCCQLAETKKSKQTTIYTFTIVVFLSIAASFINANYGFMGILLIMAMYHLKGKSQKILFIIVWSLGIYIFGQAFTGFGFRWTQVSSLSIAECVGSMSSILLILFYNGNRGKPVKWSFYIYYPVHLILLITLRSIIL